MKVFLPELAKKDGWQEAELCVEKRLPPHIVQPCLLKCAYKARYVDESYFILTINVQGTVEVSCRRCLKQFTYPYDTTFELAVCDDEKLAEKLMADYECEVSPNYHIELIDIVTDSLHLYVPEKHLDPKECDQEAYRYFHV